MSTNDDRMAEIEARVAGWTFAGPVWIADDMRWLLARVRELEEEIREHQEDCPLHIEQRHDIDGMPIP